MGEAVIQLDDVSYSYAGPKVLEHIDLTVDRGEFVGLVGPNAGGKSTLLKLILGLLSPNAGRIRVLGQRPSQGRRSVGYVPQYVRFAREFPIHVGQAVLLGRLGRTGLIGGYRARDREIARRVMEQTEVLDIAARRLDTLSGGQLQRVLLARALACEPQILMLDEPTSNIDLRLETDIFDLLKRLNSEMTILLVSHDVAFITEYVTRVACLNRTLLCHQTANIDGELIARLYGEPVRMIQHVH
jgi:zinc transport system ATP-binding protein